MQEAAGFEETSGRVGEAMDALVDDTRVTLESHRDSSQSLVENTLRSVNHSLFVALGLKPDLSEPGCFVDAVLVRNSIDIEPDF